MLAICTIAKRKSRDILIGKQHFGGSIFLENIFSKF
jgi:hypothetical protein